MINELLLIHFQLLKCLLLAYLNLKRNGSRIEYTWIFFSSREMKCISLSVCSQLFTTRDCKRVALSPRNKCFETSKIYSFILLSKHLLIVIIISRNKVNKLKMPGSFRSRVSSSKADN